jgi:hypothetical protein
MNSSRRGSHDKATMAIGRGLGRGCAVAPGLSGTYVRADWFQEPPFPHHHGAESRIWQPIAAGYFCVLRVTPER